MSPAAQLYGGEVVFSPLGFRVVGITFPRYLTGPSLQVCRVRNDGKVCDPTNGGVKISTSSGLPASKATIEFSGIQVLLLKMPEASISDDLNSEGIADSWFRVTTLMDPNTTFSLPSG